MVRHGTGVDKGTSTNFYETLGMIDFLETNNVYYMGALILWNLEVLREERHQQILRELG